MPEPSRSSHVHHTRQKSRSSSSHDHSNSGYLEPVYYFIGAILLLILLRLLHADLLPAAIGGTGIVLVAISKQRRYMPGVVLSGIFLFTMSMAFIWEWATHYLKFVLSAEIVSGERVFSSGFVDSLVPVVLVWIFYRQLKIIRNHSSQNKSFKSLFVKLSKLFFYLLSSMLCFWIIAWLLLRFQSLTSLRIQDSVMVAGALTLLIAGVPAIVYISKGAPSSEKHHHHHHHHHRNDLEKNVEQS